MYCALLVYVCSDVLCACRTKFIAGTECSKIRQNCNFGSNFQIGRKWFLLQILFIPTYILGILFLENFMNFIKIFWPCFLGFQALSSSILSNLHRNFVLTLLVKFYLAKLLISCWNHVGIWRSNPSSDANSTVDDQPYWFWYWLKGLNSNFSNFRAL